MKSRLGFVSNSSSTAFILDRRLPSIARWVASNYNAIPAPKGAGRLTCIAVGQEAVSYAHFLNEYEKDWGGSALGALILEWAEKIGTENVVFARESDEGMGGDLGPDFPTIRALAEMEYH